MTEDPTACVEPSAGVVAPQAEEPQVERVAKEAAMATVRVGQEAPDFELNAYMDGGFKNIKLSDYRGKWVVLCFYPGDFTFV